MQFAIALGNFDGVHKGHAKLIEKTIQLAGEANITPMVFTFLQNPSNIVSNKKTTPQITNYDEKERRINNLGINRIINTDFLKIKDFSAEDFVKYLINKYNAAILVCGFNFFFGKNREGNSKTLLTLCKKYNIKGYVLPSVKIDGVTVSSTEIRNLIANGKMEKVNMLLTEPFLINSKVIHGKKIGRTIGIPTINQNFDKNALIPSYGVYITKTIIENNVYPSITNIGLKPTVTDENKISIETHILNDQNNDYDFYDLKISVVFYKKIRNEIKFSSLSDLKKQIGNDINDVKKYFNI